MWCGTSRFGFRHLGKVTKTKTLVPWKSIKNNRIAAANKWAFAKSLSSVSSASRVGNASEQSKQKHAKVKPFDKVRACVDASVSCKGCVDV